MLVAILSPKPEALTAAIKQSGDRALITTDLIDAPFVRDNGIDFIVSYGYRHILSLETLAAAPRGNCNLHISMLPWNRGADPNFWSWVDNTPKGVTIHQMAKGLDTGPILCQRAVQFEPGDTLSSSYERLSRAIEDLFSERWNEIRSGAIKPVPQVTPGSYHRSSDKSDLMSRLPLGFATPCETVRSLKAPIGIDT